MLKLERLEAGYGISPVLREVEVEIGAGEAVTLLGRNGVGKTTLLRTIAGLHPASAGKVLLDGHDLTRAPAFQRARLGIALVPQGRGIFPHLTVEQNLALGWCAAGERQKPGPVPGYLFEMFPALQALRARQGGVLSGGEQQQLAIARALVAKPRLLLLDEPTEGIQPSIVQEIGRALNRIRAELKIAVLLVEQYLQFAWSIADRYYVMQRGRIVAAGETRTHAADSVAHLLSI